MPIYKFQRSEKRIEQKETNLIILSMPTEELKAVVSLLYISGARISEILSLRRENIIEDIESIQINIISLKQKKKKRETFYIQNERPLTFRRDTPFMNYILEYIKGVPKSEKLFNVTRFQVWYYIKRANMFCSPHCFRHSRLQRLADLGATAHQIRMFAGHSKIDSSVSYIESSSRSLKPLKELVD